MAKIKKILATPLLLLVIAGIVVIVASACASLVQNSFFQVKVTNVRFETFEADGTTHKGEMSGLLYMPKGVDKNNPRPAVALTHGYLNNKEMQEIGAIELSRRGYVVLAFDQYDHGDSFWDTPGEFSFYMTSVSDAANWLYKQDYVLKDAAGNGMLGVSGHSMGGFSSHAAVIFDELSFTVTGYRKIAASLAVGADFRYVSPYFPDPYQYFQTRSSGTIAAHWDQFFFNSTSSNTVIYKDYVKDAVGLAFLGQTEAEAGKWYDRDGGQRIIYTPNETHPQNTWSLESGANTITFFEEAFTYQLNLYGLGQLSDYNIKTGSTGQTWWVKEMFTLIALVALIVMIFPAFGLLSKVPFLREAVSTENNNLEPAYEGPQGDGNVPEASIEQNAKEEVVVEEEKKDKKKANPLKWIIIAFSTMVSVFYLTPLMDQNAATLGQLGTHISGIISLVVVILVALWIIAIVMKAKDSDKAEQMLKTAKTATLYGLLVILVGIAFRWLLTHGKLLSTNAWFNAPSVNAIVFWALGSAGLIFLITFATYPLVNAGVEKSQNPFGLKTSWKKFGASVLIALGLVIGVLLLVAIIGWIFLTDFRFYTYAIQIFNSVQFVSALRYIPLFFIYYLAAAVTVYVNTKGMKGWKADLLAAFLLAGPVVIFLIYQYSVLYTSGTAPYPNFALNAILCVGLVPTLVVAAITSRRFSEKTGSVWAAVIFNTLLFTLITLANTTVYQLSF
ncbi:alpha/beta hydrolase [Acholeplasma sp. OttesenSCG-928-E16]|nr:alpha/beta hydrolase [Acholeplasma sp. OttesenSCG-928-E16]